ncbi:MAG: PAS domain-containing sensor histidine kinase [bacterium]|nr:MAG: PAS domain-containing sensor histidine kinase [bacterium]
MNPLRILLSFPDGLAVFDNKLEVVFINPAFYEILKLPSNSQAEKTARSLFRDVPEITARLGTLFKDGVGYMNHDFVIKKKGSDSVSAYLAINPIDFGKNETGACVTARSNLGKRELRLEREKEGKISMLSMMAAGLAHEIKNPLGGIKGVAQLIAQEHDDMAEYSRLIVKETERINSMVTELLSLGKEKRQKRKNINIHQALDEILALQEPVFLKKDIAVVKDYDPSLPLIKTAPDRIKQLFLNLTNNAVETMTRGGRLRVKTRKALIPAPTAGDKGKKSMMSIEFIDSGKGINPKIAKHLFTPFITSKRGGTGLGLVISLKIARDHGGTITLENHRNEPGATAKVIIPIS